MLKRWFGGPAAGAEEDAVAGGAEGAAVSPTEAQAQAQAEAEAARVAAGLDRTRGGWLARLGGLFGAADITDDTWEALEERLIRADVGVGTAAALVADLRAQARYAGLRRADELPRLLRRVMVRALTEPGATGGAISARIGAAADGPLAPPAGGGAPGSPGPRVLLMVGVNGSGKTTTAAKLAARARAEGAAPLLVAADTFRAAAIDQLAEWGARLQVPVARGTPGADPGAVAFDALSSAAGRAADLVIVDTAGRLHTQRNLMGELEKVRRVVAKAVEGAPHETWLVLDATTGQNGLAQAREFARAVGVTGVVLAKLDSSARGGVAFAVTRELGLPIVFVGVGEAVADLLPFDAARFVDGLLGPLDAA